MKKIVILIVIFLSQVSFAQDIGITGVTVSQISTSEINVNLKVITNASEFISSSYSILGNDIYLNVCYITAGLGIIINLENDIPITVATNTTYNLNITIFQSFAEICDFNNIQDTASLSFTTPLSEPVTLSTTTMIGNNNNLLCPNPTTGNITINTTIDSIVIYDNIGRKVKQYIGLKSNNIDISEFENGIYFIERNEFNKRVVQKIILKK